MPFTWKKLAKAKALKVILGAALKVLDTTEDVLNTTPIPGAAAIITIILDIVKRKDRASSNAERNAEQQERWRDLVSQLRECETDLDNTPHDSLSGLREASQALARELQGYARELRKATAHKFRPRCMTCTGDEKALQHFLRKSNEAIADYQIAQGRRIDECIPKLQRVVGAIDTKVDQVDTTKVDRIDENRLYITPGVPGSATEQNIPYPSTLDLVTSTPAVHQPHSDLVEVLPNLKEALLEDSLLSKPAPTSTSATTTEDEQQPQQKAAEKRSRSRGRRGKSSRSSSPAVSRLTPSPPISNAASQSSESVDSFQSLSEGYTHPSAKPLLASSSGPPSRSASRAPSTNPSRATSRDRDAGHDWLRGRLPTSSATWTNPAAATNPMKVLSTIKNTIQVERDESRIKDFGRLVETRRATLASYKPRAVVDTANEDVEAYLRAELDNIPSKPGIRNLNLPRDWITEDDIQDLLEYAGAERVNSNSTSTEKELFVYIATVIRFIGDTRRCDPQKLLHIVLSTTPPLPTYRPFEGLDNLYTLVLDAAHEGAEDLLQRFHAVASGIMIAMEVNQSSLHPTASSTLIENLFELPEGEVLKTVDNLQSVIQYPGPNSTLPSFHHRSFTDFLTSEDRSGPRYYLDLMPYRKQFALGCLRVIATSPLKAKVTTAMRKKDYVYLPTVHPSPEFQHASLFLIHWNQHISNLDDENLLEELEKFTRNDYGWWIEVLTQVEMSDYCPPVLHNVRGLPVLFQPLAYWAGRDILAGKQLLALLHKVLRRYISTVAPRQAGKSRIGAQIPTMLIEKHIYELRDRLDSNGDTPSASLTALIFLTFAEEVEATVDKYQRSVGNKAEVERNRERTLFLRRQLKPLLVENGFIEEDNKLFERGGVSSVKRIRRRITRL